MDHVSVRHPRAWQSRMSSKLINRSVLFIATATSHQTLPPPDIQHSTCSFLWRVTFFIVPSMPTPHSPVVHRYPNSRSPPL